MHSSRGLMLLVVALCFACQSPGSDDDGGIADAGSVDAGATDAGSVDAGAADAGSADAGFQIGAPITATADQWTWVPFSNAFCANGAATGIGLNPSSTGSRVLIYLEGGGACWSDLTCFTLMTASYFTTGYGEADFVSESSDTTYLAEPGGFFDRTSASNPFKDYSYVYVPYCTGDIHSGNNVVQYPSGTAMFVGYANMTAYLERLVPTFPSADRVYIAGSSAGGFGAIYNWWQTQQAFGSVRVDMIDDSGTLLPASIQAEGTPGQQQLLATQWNIAATMPPGCTGCTTSFDALYSMYETTFPTHSGALLSYSSDTVLPNFDGITEAEFTMGLDEELTAHFGASSNLKAFVYDGSGHVLWFSPALTTNGVTLQTFLTQMVSDDASWATVEP